MTVHGDVECETVECASCGRTEMKSDATRAVVGDVKEKWVYSHTGEKRYVYEAPARDLWLCEFCCSYDGLATINLGSKYTLTIHNGVSIMHWMLGATAAVLVFALLLLVVVTA